MFDDSFNLASMSIERNSKTAENEVDCEDSGRQDWITECEESLKDHEALCKATINALKEIFSEDPLLNDLPCDVSPDEVGAQIAVLNGQAIIVYVERETLPPLKVIVAQARATLLDLKKAIRRAYELEQYRNRRGNQNSNIRRFKSFPANISWRYIWRTYLLSHESQPLTSDSQSLSSYGVGNKSVLKFVKKSKVYRLRGRNKI